MVTEIMEGCGRKQLWLNLRSYPTKILGWEAGLQASCWTWYLTNTKQVCHTFTASFVLGLLYSVPMSASFNSILKHQLSCILQLLSWVLADRICFDELLPEEIIQLFNIWSGACGSVVGWGTMPQAGRSRVQVWMRWIFFNWPNPSSCTVALGSTQPLTEMSTRKIPGG
jgi:hypothetical protein